MSTGHLVGQFDGRQLRVHVSGLADQIVEDLKRRILDGEIAPGAKLPGRSVPADFAFHLMVAVASGNRFNADPEAARAAARVHLTNTRHRLTSSAGRSGAE